MTRTPEPPIVDAPPAADCVTLYDREHLKLYVRLLDAENSGASVAEVARILLGIDPESEPERAERVHASHLGRARWMTEHGYRDLLQRGLP
ncbi:DNA -binding domain-containing protein [Roseospira goensis]|uniref:T6SS Transcription factor RovC-like DNA binding domain-containing protein n=1 Tax=Roseospira goensis TaxID=391922 RepID=A0A7W6WM15_9PROT|nr:DUF2285 domain-containing protein [Roseospira goensis]MBB4287956.1 hypothetical protein [Roseospira goensis]